MDVVISRRSVVGDAGDLGMIMVLVLYVMVVVMLEMMTDVMVVDADVLVTVCGGGGSDVARRYVVAVADVVYKRSMLGGLGVGGVVVDEAMEVTHLPTEVCGWHVTEVQQPA